MSKESLEKQADRAESTADQTVDDALQETLRDAAMEYREKAQGKIVTPAMKAMRCSVEKRNSAGLSRLKGKHGKLL